jgi:hypothetical protein
MSEHPRLGVDDVAATWHLAQAPGGRVDRRRTVWTGWIGFAAAMMVMIGAFNAIEGLAGLLTDDFYLVAPTAVLAFDLTGWCWVHTIVGVLVALTGLVLPSGAAWARVLTVLLLVLNAAAQLAFIAVYPLWSLIVITLCVVVIWAVVVHGDEASG